ncbi:MAG: 16S rRNA (adenine(1518)-N(6)/adenine(1519)-N(6))-dimethyltransferase RsmA [Chromatiales bacterium]
MNHRPRKRFGQNFLTDPSIIDAIVRAIHATPDDLLVEIGPGRGAITRELLARAHHLHAVELDRDLIPVLQQRFADSGDFLLHSADALQFDFCALDDGRGLRIVGNLPYNISTPLLFHLLEQRHCLRDMHFMLQKEVVDRLAASPHSKAYGRLSVITQALCQVTPLFEIPPQAFDPPPKVQSAFVQLIPHSSPPVTAEQWPAFTQLVTAAFAHRRKTLRNNLKNLLRENAENDCGIDLGQRAETLYIEDFLQLSRYLAEI